MPKPPDGIREGDEAALSELASALYEQLHRIAARHLRGERPDHTLQATALVHEAYLKLFEHAGRTFADRAHFLAVASRVMRQVLVDYARARATQKRGGGEQVVWSTALDVPGDSGLERLEILDLDRALEALARQDALLAQVIEMRYFGGMTAEETAGVLGLSGHVVRHHLRLGQAWLRRELARESGI